MSEGFTDEDRAAYMFASSLPDPMFAEIGRVIASWTELEHEWLLTLLSVLARHLPRTDIESGAVEVPFEIAKQLTLSLDQQTGLLRDWAVQTAVEEGPKQRLFATLDRLEKARANRDFVAHGRWVPLMNEEAMDAAAKMPVGSTVPHHFHLHPDRAHRIGIRWRLLTRDDGPVECTLEQLQRMTIENNQLGWELRALTLQDQIFPLGALTPTRAPKR